MNEFEKQWQRKLLNALQKIGREELYAELKEEIADESSNVWTKKLMQTLMEKLSEVELKEVMRGCACHAGKDNLVAIRDEYALNQDLKKAHEMYRQVFLDFIREYKNLNDEEMQYLIDNDIGSAGILRDNIITVTKIPKEFSRYLKSNDPVEKRYLYCHCPRVREFLKTETKPLPQEYCYCGAGFFQDIWEFITQKPVQVKVLKSLLNGADRCMIEITID